VSSQQLTPRRAQSGRAESALGTLRQLQELAIKLRGAKSLEAAWASNEIGRILHGSAEMDRAEEAFKKALQVRARMCVYVICMQMFV
jgi:hypothetical protein